MLRRQPVLDADHGYVAGIGERFEALVLLVGGAQDPAAAVEMEIDAIDAVREEAA